MAILRIECKVEDGSWEFRMGLSIPVAAEESELNSFQKDVNWHVRMRLCRLARKGMTAMSDCSSESISWRIAW